MKIIHGKDYYDNANCGIDPDIIFVRDGVAPTDKFPFKIRKLSCTKPRDKFSSSYNNDSANYNLQLFYVMFAGNVYPGFRSIYQKPHQQAIAKFSDTWVDIIPVEDSSHYIIGHFYDYESAIDSYLEAGYMIDYIGWRNDATDRQLIYDHFHNVNPNWTQWLIKNKVTVGIYFSSRGYYNNNNNPKFVSINSPCLADVDFYKVKDPFTANQDIASYVGGVLPANANPMVEISNLDKVRKAGFDTKSSFRKPKTKHA